MKQGESMHMIRRLAALALTVALALPASAQETLRIGLVTVLTGPQATLGQQVRDGFALGVKMTGGKLGGLPTEVTIVDDEPFGVDNPESLARARALLSS